MNKAVALVLGVAIALAGMAGTAGAQPANKRFFLFEIGSDDDAPARVIAAGVINALGEEVIVDGTFDEGTGEFTVVDEFDFPEGTLFVTIEGQGGRSEMERSLHIDAEPGSG